MALRSPHDSATEYYAIMADGGIMDVTRFHQNIASTECAAVVCGKLGQAP